MAPLINISIPPLTRGLLLGLLACTLLNYGVRYRTSMPSFGSIRGTTGGGGSSTLLASGTHYNAPYLTIIPAESIMYPWVLLVATLTEQNVLGLVATGATLFYGGRYLERAWSSREYTKFVLLIALLPNLIAFATYYLLFILTRDMATITTAISGGIAIQAAFLVAFKQLVPEHTVQLFRGLFRMRVKHFPALFLLANTISGLVFGTDTAMLLAWFGFFTSWTYLRFYRISPSLFSTSTGQETGSGATSAAADHASIKGDASDTFAFAAFFPDALRPPIAAASDVVYSLLVSIRVCTPFSAADVDAGNEQASARDGTSVLPSLLNPDRSAGATAEAERRRALALRALDQRLNANTSQPRAPPRAPPVASSQAEKKALDSAPAPVTAHAVEPATVQSHAGAEQDVD